MIPSSSCPIGKYGVAAWYRRHCAVRTGMPAARRSISLKNRDLPTPGSPTISITPPAPGGQPVDDRDDARELVVAPDERQLRACDLGAHAPRLARPRRP